MAQNFGPKQTAFVNKYSAAVGALLDIVDQLTLFDAEFANNAYGTGGANAIGDPVVQTVLPAQTAAIFNASEAAVVTVLGTVASVRSSLENMRP